MIMDELELLSRPGQVEPARQEVVDPGRWPG
jgi:hypothetical protein